MTGVQQRHGDGDAATADGAWRQFAAVKKDWPVKGGEVPDLAAAQFDTFATALKL